MTSLYTAIISAVVSALISFLVALFSERIRFIIFKPKLIVHFDPATPGCRVDNSGEHIFIRVKILNRSRNIARGCRAFLVGIELSNLDKLEVDNPQLSWPHIDFVGVDIRKSIPQFLNVVYSTKTANNMLFASKFANSYLRSLQSDRDSCVASVIVTTEDGYLWLFKFQILWNGDWNRIQGKLL